MEDLCWWFLEDIYAAFFFADLVISVGMKKHFFADGLFESSGSSMLLLELMELCFYLDVHLYTQSLMSYNEYIRIYIYIYIHNHIIYIYICA